MDEMETHRRVKYAPAATSLALPCSIAFRDPENVFLAYDIRYIYNGPGSRLDFKRMLVP
jgi:hypothetical protein